MPRKRVMSWYSLRKETDLIYEGIATLIPSLPDLSGVNDIKKLT